MPSLQAPRAKLSPLGRRGREPKAGWPVENRMKTVSLAARAIHVTTAGLLGLLWFCASADRTSAANTPIPSPAEAIARGLSFLTNLYDPELKLLPEFRGATVFWLYHDNYLAAKVLAPSQPKLAATLIESIHSRGIRYSGKIEIVFDEAFAPLPFRHFILTNVVEVGRKQIRTEIAGPGLMKGWEAYADLRLLAALASAKGTPREAQENFAAASAMWDGKGFADPASRGLKRYAAYKLALYLLAESRLRTEGSLHAVVLHRLLAQQNPEGGIITDYVADGSWSGVANVETTCLTIQALRECCATPVERPASVR